MTYNDIIIKLGVSLETETFEAGRRTLTSPGMTRYHLRV